MRKSFIILMLIAACGCTYERTETKTLSFSAEPFTALGELNWRGKEYTAALCLSDDGVLSMAVSGGELCAPVNFSAGNGIFSMETGEHSLKLPLDRALPSSAVVEVQSALSKLDGQTAQKSAEDGLFRFESGNYSAVVDGSGAIMSLALPDGKFDFSSFSKQDKVAG